MSACPNCGSELVAGTNLALLECKSCNIYIPVSAATPAPDKFSDGDDFEHPSVAVVPKKEVSLPTRFRLNQATRNFEISWRWWNKWSWFWLVFAGFWNLVTFPMLFAVILGDDVDMEMLFFIPFVLVGGITGYLALAYVLNSTTLTVSRGMIKLSHGPLPYSGSSFDASRLDQLYCEQYVAGTVNDSPVYAFRVKALLKSGEHQVFVSALNTLQEAIYLEQEVERHLNIEDRPVAGEFR